MTTARRDVMRRRQFVRVQIFCDGPPERIENDFQEFFVGARSKEPHPIRLFVNSFGCGSSRTAPRRERRISASRILVGDRSKGSTPYSFGCSSRMYPRKRVRSRSVARHPAAEITFSGIYSRVRRTDRPFAPRFLVGETWNNVSHSRAKRDLHPIHLKVVADLLRRPSGED